MSDTTTTQALREKGPLLFVTTAYPDVTPGGRELLTAVYRDALADLLGDRLFSYELTRHAGASGNARKLLDGVRGHIDGIRTESLANILELIREQEIRRVFLDGSNLGLVAEHLRRHAPSTRIFTFCHNVEARFFWGAFRTRPGVRTLAVAAVNYAAEHKATRYSDTLIGINERDSRLMRRVHGRGADVISHMALRDSASSETAPGDPRLQERFVLFVGGTFYANLQGIEWFARHVSPRLPLPTYVVGRGFERHRASLQQNANVVVVGEVDRLAPWYNAAHCVVAPIFDGSGMKTKVAEALMHGRRVIGTPEAFSGYDAVPARLKVTCTSAESFIEAIQGVEASGATEARAELRKLYEQYYSIDALRQRLRRILDADWVEHA